MKIALVGFMGTGKSTVGPILAEELNIHFIETDTLIEKEQNQSIKEIFNNKGEKYFRKIESKILKEVITKKNNFILSTGGGIVISTENRRLLKKNTRVILLEASPDVILDRVGENKERPLLKSKNPLQKIKKLMKKRKDYYYDFKMRINTDNKTPELIVEEIKNYIGVD
ncbi:MAG: shikimate kinase [bacterium]